MRGHLGFASRLTGTCELRVALPPTLGAPGTPILSGESLEIGLRLQAGIFPEWVKLLAAFLRPQSDAQHPDPSRRAALEAPPVTTGDPGLHCYPQPPP